MAVAVQKADRVPTVAVQILPHRLPLRLLLMLTGRAPKILMLITMVLPVSTYHQVLQVAWGQHLGVALPGVPLLRPVDVRERICQLVQGHVVSGQ